MPGVHKARDHGRSGKAHQDSRPYVVVERRTSRLHSVLRGLHDLHEEEGSHPLVEAGRERVAEEVSETDKDPERGGRSSHEVAGYGGDSRHGADCSYAEDGAHGDRSSSRPVEDHSHHDEVEGTENGTGHGFVVVVEAGALQIEGPRCK